MDEDKGPINLRQWKYVSTTSIGDRYMGNTLGHSMSFPMEGNAWLEDGTQLSLWVLVRSFA